MAKQEKKYKVNEELIGDFVATLDSKPNLTTSEIFSKFPELNNDANFLQSMMDYRATLKSGKYKTEVEARVKFPEFQFDQVKKKDLSQQGSASGFAPSQGIKPGTSVFPQQNLTPEQRGSVEQITPMAPEKRYKAEKPIPSYGGQWLNSLEAGANTFNKSLAAVPGAAYDFSGALFRLAGLDVPTTSQLAEYYKDQPVGAAIGAINGYIESEGKNAERLRADSQINPEVQKGIIENIKKGNYTNAFKSAGLGIAESLPAMVGMALTGGMGSAGAGATTMSRYLAGQAASQTRMAAPFIADKWREIADDPTMSEPAKILNAIGTGYSETFYEDKFGSIGLLKMAKKILNEQGEQAAREFAKKSFLEATKEGFKKYFPLTATATSAIEEGATKWSQNSIDILTGKNPNLDPLEGVTEAMAQGGAFGLPIGAVTSAAKYTKDKKLQRRVATSQNPAVEPLVREKLNNQLESGQITPEEHSEAIATLDEARQIDATIPPTLEGDAREEANELISMRNKVQAERQSAEEEMANVDPAFRTSYEERMAERDAEAAVINDGIAGLTSPITYRNEAGKFTKEQNGKVEEITEAQFNFAKDNGFTGIKIEDTTAPVAEQGAVTNSSIIQSVKVNSIDEFIEPNEDEIKDGSTFKLIRGNVYDSNKGLGQAKNIFGIGLADALPSVFGNMEERSINKSRDIVNKKETELENISKRINELNNKGNLTSEEFTELNNLIRNKKSVENDINYAKKRVEDYEKSKSEYEQTQKENANLGLIWLTSQKETAKSYAESLSSVPSGLLGERPAPSINYDVVTVAPKKILDLTKLTDDVGSLYENEAKTEEIEDLLGIRLDYLPDYPEMAFQLFRGKSAKIVVEALKEKGYDMVRLKEGNQDNFVLINNTKTDKQNATQESSQQVIQGGEQGNQLQRDGTQEGQPQEGEGEGSTGQTTQSETDNSNRSQQSQGSEEEVSSSQPPATTGPSNQTPASGGGNNLVPPLPPNVTGGIGNSQQGPTPTSARSVEAAREALMAQLPKKKFSIKEWFQNFIEETVDDKYRIASFLRDNGAKLVESYMRLRQGASGAAKSFSEQARKAIFGGLSFKKNIKYFDTEGNEVVTSERDLLDGVITSRRVINIEKLLRDRYNKMMRLKTKVDNGTATPQEKNEYDSDVEYLRERKVIPPSGKMVYQEQKGEDGLMVANHIAYLQNIAAQLPKETLDKIVESAQKYNDYFQSLLDEQFKAGISNQKQYDALSEQQYAPRAFWERMMEEDEPSLGQREFMTKLNQGLAKLAGGSNKLVYADYEALMDMMSVAAFKRILENKAAIELSNFAKKNPKNGVIREAKRALDANGNPTFDKYGNPKYESMSEDGTRGSIVYYDNGVKKRLEVPKEFELIWYSNRDYISPEFAKSLRKWTLVNLIKKGATEWNLAFGIMQFALLDAPHVLMFTGNYNPILPLGGAQFLKDAASVSKDLYNKTGVYREAAEAGAFSDLMSRDTDLTDPSRYLNRNQNKLYKAGSEFVKFSGNVNEYFETLTRLAVFNRKKNDLLKAYEKANKTTPQKGSKAYQDIISEAAFAAKSTVDFGKSGRATKAANNVFAYLNAAVQTFNTSAKYMSDNPAQFTTKIAQLSSIGAALTLASMGYFDDDEEEKKRKTKIMSEIPSYVLRNKFVYVPSKGAEEDFFKAIGLIDDKVKYVALFPKPAVASYFVNIASDAAVRTFMPEQAKSVKETLGDVALDLRNSLPFNPENIASRNPLVSASLAAGNYDAFRKEVIVKNRESITDYQEGQNKKTIAPIYKALGEMSKGIVGKEGLSPAITQAVVDKMITNPERNPLYNLGFQAASYAAVEASGNEILKKEFLERFDPTMGFAVRLKATPARKQKEDREIEEIKDKGTLTYEAKSLLQQSAFGGGNKQQMDMIINKTLSKEVLSKMENLELTDKDIKEIKEDLTEYAAQVRSIYQMEMPEWFSNVPKQPSNKDMAEEIMFQTSGMSKQQRDMIVRQLIKYKFISASDDQGSVKFYMRELQKK